MANPMQRVETRAPRNEYQKWVALGNKMLRKSPADYIAFIGNKLPQVRTALRKSKRIRAQILPYQAAALFELASHYNSDGSEILEIGTADGYSASIMAQAAPKAHIVTLNPVASEIGRARANLRAYPNVEIICAASWDHLKTYSGPTLDMIFVDGDHKRTWRDVLWYNHLNDPYMYGAGLMLFHDYTPKEVGVVQAVDDMATKLQRRAIFLLQDAQLIGMAGFYRFEGDEV